MTVDVRSWIATLTMIVAVPIVGGCRATQSSPQVSASTKPADTRPTTTLSDEDVLRMLQEEVSDDANAERRNRFLSSHVQLMPAEFWLKLNPIRFSQERLVRYGRCVIGPCLRIAQDPTQDQVMARRAWETAFKFEEPRIYAALAHAAENHRWDSIDYYVLVADCLDMDDAIMQDAGLESRHDLAALLDRLSQAPDCRKEVLPLLDAAMKDERGFGLSYGSTFLIRWLNRIGDQDLDDWLAARCPSGLAWRNEQLRRGYDPLTAFDGFRLEFHHGMLADAVNRVFDDSDDRKQCLELLQIVLAERDRERVPVGWEDRLRKWYWKNRDRFVYDHASRRFVIDDQPSAESNRPR